MPIRKVIEEGPEDTDDAAGHMQLRKVVKDGVEDDDTEGNVAKAGRSVPPAANPGKAGKFRG